MIRMWPFPRIKWGLWESLYMEVEHWWDQKRSVTVQSLSSWSSNGLSVTTSETICPMLLYVCTKLQPIDIYIKTSSEVNATVQRWINKLSNFNFSIHYHYKTGAQNVVAVALSWFLIEKEHCRDQYSKTCCSVEIKSVFDVAINQQHDSETWIAAVNVTSISFNDI